MRSAGVLALQGAVEEHIDALSRLGWKGIPVKQPNDLVHIDALIIPGGESTAISRLMIASGLHDAIRTFGRPVLGTCAGLILVCSDIAESEENPGGREGGSSTGKDLHSSHRVIPLGLIDATVQRNGFGRQVDSFEATLAVAGVARDVTGVFIRAPYIERLGEGAKALAFFDDRIVMAEQGNVVVCSFHPELTTDDRVLEYFLAKAK